MWQRSTASEFSLLDELGNRNSAEHPPPQASLALCLYVTAGRKELLCASIHVYTILKTPQSVISHLYLVRCSCFPYFRLCSLIHALQSADHLVAQGVIKSSAHCKNRFQVSLCHMDALTSEATA